jgi:hypothetical protein
MKIRIASIAVAILLVAVGCRDRASEKRIAELESRLDKLEGTKAAPTPAATVPGVTPEVKDEKPSGPLPVIEFSATDHDFGSVAEGQKVSFTYNVKNTGSAPLIIQEAKASCGCTVPDWTKTPILPGGTGFVKAEFDTKGKSGVNNKTITITSNAWPKTNILKFTAMVTPRPDGANGPKK